MTFKGVHKMTPNQRLLRRRKVRLPPEERDLTDIDDMELYLAEHLRDWQLQVQRDVFTQYLAVVEAELTRARDNLKVTRNDVARENHYLGYISAFELIQAQTKRAIQARERAIEAKEPVLWEPPA